MDLLFTHFLKAMFFPPGGLILLAICGIVFLKSRFEIARVVIITSIALLTIISLPIVSGTLIGIVETYPPINDKKLEDTEAKAIVILGGGRDKKAIEYGGESVSAITLQRIRYGAYLYNKTHIPLLVTGGFIHEEDTAEGILMKNALTHEFGVPVKWTENRSRNTAENAMYSMEMLAQENIETIILITSAWHMFRAANIFEEKGFNVIPAPTAFKGSVSASRKVSFFDFVPSATALKNSYFALHEMVGFVWYLIRY